MNGRSPSIKREVNSPFRGSSETLDAANEGHNTLGFGRGPRNTVSFGEDTSSSRPRMESRPVLYLDQRLRRFLRAVLGTRGLDDGFGVYGHLPRRGWLAATNSIPGARYDWSWKEDLTIGSGQHRMMANG